MRIGRLVLPLTLSFHTDSYSRPNQLAGSIGKGWSLSTELQITRQIKAKILNGELQQGDALPSIRLLAKELRISVITTKRAYEDLEADGFITTMPGRGSFVAPQNPALHREESLKQMEEHLQHGLYDLESDNLGQEKNDL